MGLGSLLGGVPVVGDLFGGGAADAAERAASTQAAAQREALDYLREREAVPQAYREQALGALGGLYGLAAPSFNAPVVQAPAVTGTAGSGSRSLRDAIGGVSDKRLTTDAQELSYDPVSFDIMERIQQNPIYQAQLEMAQLGSQRALEEGEEAILRNRAMTGGLRSGGTQRGLSDLAAGIQERQTAAENQALINAYQEQVQGLRGLAQLPSYAPQIAQQTAGIGQTLAQGQIGAAQAQQSGLGDLLGAGLGIANMFFSDSRLKTNVEKIGDLNGWPIYSWDWNEKAKEIGLSGSSTGVIAQDVERRCPDAISYNDNGYMMVDYSILGVQ